jgi:hypothetical protein
MKKIYNNRLRKFADHIAEIKTSENKTLIPVRLVTLHQRANRSQTIYLPAWIIKELPNIFPHEWLLDEFDDPVLIDYQEDGNWVCMLIDFFNLDQDEFAQVFALKNYRQENSANYLDGQAIAFNILQLIEART